MNAPAESSAKPRMFKNIPSLGSFGKKVGGIMGVGFEPQQAQQPDVASVPISSDAPKPIEVATTQVDFNAVKPQEDFVQPSVPVPAPITESATSSVAPEQPTIVPAEPVVAQTPVAEVSMESTVPASKPPEEPSPPTNKATEPTIPEPSPQEHKVENDSLSKVELVKNFPEPAEPPPPLSPVTRPDAPIISVSEAPKESAVPSMDLGKPEVVGETVPEDPIATRLLDVDSEKFIHDGILDEEAFTAAITAEKIAKNPKAQNLENRLQAFGVNSKVTARLVQSILSETQKAA